MASNSRNNSVAKENTSRNKSGTRENIQGKSVKKMKKPSQEVLPRVTAYKRQVHGQPKFSFGRSTRDDPSKMAVPGPGSY